ncbi:MAG TPA: lysylphosphatidylglycerol synthase domain-containing protein [Chitinophagaceae bacterium]|nr:lysylphosphatidylglycerol synthase domain-containing protein [Chitinophagaceae bacterium]
MKLNRNNKPDFIRTFINYFLGPLLFIWLSWSIYTEIKNQPDIEGAWLQVRQSFSSPLLLNILGVLFLMIINWAIEALKWQLAVKPVQPVTFLKAFRAVLSGVSFSVSTPNRVGEYLGRVLYMEEGNRLRTIAVTMVSSISQLIITLCMGLLGLILLKKTIEQQQLVSGLWLLVLIYGVLIVVILLLLFYFRLHWLARWISKISFLKKYSYLVEAVGQFDTSILLRMLALSFARFAVFILQYYLLYIFFDVEIGWWAACWTVSVSFLIMAIIPTFAIAELGLKGKVALLVTGLFSANKAGIFFATAGIWFINLVIPAISGSILILGLRKFYKSKDQSSDSLKN